MGLSEIVSNSSANVLKNCMSKVIKKLTLCVTRVLLLEKAFEQMSHLYFFTGGGLFGSRGRLVPYPSMPW